MKTNELIFKDIDNEKQVDIWYDLICKEKVMDSGHKEDWVGEVIYEIYYKNQLVGYIAYSRWYDSYCLSCIYILSEFRRQGIATAAIRKLNFQLKGKGVWFYGFVHKDNSGAIFMYHNLGFKYLTKNGAGYLYEAPNENCTISNDGFYEFGKRLE